MGAQIIHHQMDGVSGRVIPGNLQDKIGKLGRRASGRNLGEMNSRLGFDAGPRTDREAKHKPKLKEIIRQQE
jgi:hypothetical protein